MLRIKTPAKINLGLKILGKRIDGYHELETLFQMVDLFDHLELEERPQGIEIECATPGIPTGETNLVFRAARLLQNDFPDRARGVRVRLTKQIPAGAGLGGGSGNAAGALLALNVLWDLKLPREHLIPYAHKIGSDVPFFLLSPCALGRGRGELLESLQPSKKFNVVLVYPRFSVATSWVYQNLNLKLTNSENDISILRKFLCKSQFGDLGSRLFNDLEPVVTERFPVIQSIKDALRTQGAAGCLLSGSGSTVFGLFDKENLANQAVAALREHDWDLYLTRSVRSFSEFLPEEILDYPKSSGERS